MDLNNRLYDYNEMDFSMDNLNNYVRNLVIGKVVKTQDKNIKIHIFDKISHKIPEIALEHLMSSVYGNDGICSKYLENNLLNKDVSTLSPFINKIVFIMEQGLSRDEVKTIENLASDIGEAVLVFDDINLACIDEYSFYNGYTYKELS